MLQDVVRRLFDINEYRNESDSEKGLLGKFNHNDRAGATRSIPSASATITARPRATWSCWPRATPGSSFRRRYFAIDGVTDILDWLIKDERYAVCSLAAGGDWFSNIFHSGEYIEELPKVSPDVFLVSGGSVTT